MVIARVVITLFSCVGVEGRLLFRPMQCFGGKMVTEGFVRFCCVHTGKPAFHNLRMCINSLFEVVTHYTCKDSQCSQWY